MFTVNTDFAQTEVDQRQVNLTRFSLFFPERRDFFLDGATFFDFRSDGQRGFFGCGGNNDDQVIPFFSRRIGLSASGTPQKIDFGTKVTGQAGAQDVGILHVRTGEDEGFTSEDFTVARVKRRMLRAVVHRRDLYPPGSAARRRRSPPHRRPRHVAVDLQFQGSQNLEAAAWFLQRDAARRVAAATRHSAPPSTTRTIGGTPASTPRRFRSTSTRRSASSARKNFRKYSPTIGFQPRPQQQPVCPPVRDSRAIWTS